MRVFVAGATGAVGSRLTRLLVSSGHSVVGLTRTGTKAETIERLGAEVSVADALNRAAIVAAVTDAKPDVIVHEMTAISAANDLRRFDRSFAATNRLRSQGLDNLLAAAKQAGRPRVIAQSFCGWPYARIGGPVKSEDDPLEPDPAPQMRQPLAAIRYLENSLMAAPGIAGLILRYGAFYGCGTGLFDGPLIDGLRRRRVPLIGGGNGWWSFVHIDDAAAATAIAVERGAPVIYNIVDDEPAPVREWLPALAAMLGANPPRHVPKWLARIAVSATSGTPSITGAALLAVAAVGSARLALIRSASTTKSCQIFAGRSPPTTSFIGVLSSLPAHTPTTKSVVKPTNQASR